ncbi:MAG: hypothetical protein ACRYFU_05695 [Janthinobacterium lividum]
MKALVRDLVAGDPADGSSSGLRQEPEASNTRRKDSDTSVLMAKGGLPAKISVAFDPEIEAMDEGVRGKAYAQNLADLTDKPSKKVQELSDRSILRPSLWRSQTHPLSDISLYDDLEREISGIIDSMPVRQEELTRKDAKGVNRLHRRADGTDAYDAVAAKPLVHDAFRRSLAQVARQGFDPINDLAKQHEGLMTRRAAADKAATKANKEHDAAVAKGDVDGMGRKGEELSTQRAIVAELDKQIAAVATKVDELQKPRLADRLGEMRSLVEGDNPGLTASNTDTAKAKNELEKARREAEKLSTALPQGSRFALPRLFRSGTKTRDRKREELQAKEKLQAKIVGLIEKVGACELRDELRALEIEVEQAARPGRAQELEGRIEALADRLGVVRQDAAKPVAGPVNEASQAAPSAGPAQPEGGPPALARSVEEPTVNIQRLKEEYDSTLRSALELDGSQKNGLPTASISPSVMRGQLKMLRDELRQARSELWAQRDERGNVDLVAWRGKWRTYCDISAKVGELSAHPGVKQARQAYMARYYGGRLPEKPYRPASIGQARNDDIKISDKAGPFSSSYVVPNASS